MKKTDLQISRKLEQLLSNVGDMSLKRRGQVIIEELDLKEGDNIIDLGCGDGFYLHLLSNLPIKLNLTGLDNDDWTISRTKINLKGKKIRIYKGDVTNMPFKTAAFDKVVISEVIEHIDNDIKALKEVKRILKPEGMMVLTTPNYDYPLFWDPFNWILEHLFKTHIKRDFWNGIWLGHVRLYRHEELSKVIARAGFKIEKTKDLTGWCLPFNHYLINVVARMLYANKLSSEVSNSIDKFKNKKKPLLIRSAFWAMNTFDKLNEILPVKNGVHIFVKARN
jgi:2-polyprenyl-6-hydroxyphenyl methylase / 3-demethylubiquinone-9 3-methyltransferase